jgi:hypothetical protein
MGEERDEVEKGREESREAQQDSNEEKQPAWNM